MTNNEPSNIPNKYSRELSGRLVPRQKIRSHPVTFLSTLSKNHALASKSVIQQRPKKLPPLQPLPEIKKEEEPEPTVLPLTKDPLEYIKRAKEGLDTREYVYLEPSGIIEDSEHPTCLRIIPAKNMNESNFWTLSLKGLTHFNRPNVDFIPLDQWLRETDLFSKILAVPFFKYQRQWRHFKMWRRNIQNAKLVKAQNGLSTNLFFANPILRPSFIKIQKELNNLRKIKLYTIDPKKIYTLADFAEENEKYRGEIRQKFDEFFNNLVSIVALACEKLMDSSRAVDIEKEENESPLEQLIAQYEREHKAPEAKSTYEAPGVLKYTNKAMHNALCQLAVRFIRMVDYVVVNGLKNICTISMLELYSTLSTLMVNRSEKIGYKLDDLEEIQLPKEWEYAYHTMVDMANNIFTKPIFAVDAIYNNGLEWNPAMEDLISRVETVRKESVRMLLTIPRLIPHPVFKPYISSVIESGPMGNKKLTVPDISNIIQNDPIYKNTIEKQKKILVKSYDILDFYAKAFQSSVEMFEKNSHFDVSFLENETLTAKEIRDSIKELKCQESALKAIVDYSDIGIFQCCTKQMKKLFMNSPSNCIAQIKSGIKSIASKLLLVFGEKVRTSYDELSVQTENVEQFVTYINSIKKNQESIRSLYHLHELIKDLYKLGQEMGIDIPQSEQNEYQELSPVFDAIKRYLSYADENKQQLMPKFTSMLDKSVASLHSRVIEVVLLANNEKLSSLETTPAEANAILEEVVTKTSEINETAKQYNEFQGTMAVNKTEFDDVQHLVENVELTRLLWETKTQWLKMTDDWCNTPFASIDSEKMVEEIHRFVDKANKVAGGLPDNKVAQDLKERVDHFSTMVPIISDLKNPALKQTHTEQIEQLLGDSLFGDSGFLFGKLVNLKAYNFVAKISQISEQATNEQALLDQLNNVKNNIEALQFTTTPIKNIKNAYYLEGIETINIAIDDAISVLSSIRASKYVAQHRTRAEEWVKLIRQFQQSIETIDRCQSQFCYFVDVFLNPDISRQLASDAKELSSIERTWKSFSGRAFDDPYAFKLCSTGNVVAELAIANVTMDGIRKNIEQFLETKRSAFPRLYLLSNNEFINLLSKPKDVQALIPYLPKMFTGVNNLEFIMDGHIPSIAFVVNDVGERVQIRPVKYHANIEIWLQGLCESLQKTVKNDIKSSQQKYKEMVREDWFQVTTTQCVLIVSALERCKSIENALNSQDPGKALFDLENEIQQSMNNLIRFTHLELRPFEKNKIESLMLSDMFYRQITEELQLCNAKNDQDPNWTKQMVYRWDESSNELVVNQCYESYPFGYEYTGKSTRIIQTQNVFNTFLQISSALKTFYSPAIIGDHLIGKTETVLSIAEALGYFVATRTCTSTLTTSQITSLLKGAAQGGYWICLENFTSLRQDVLSAISEEFQAIKYAKEAQLRKVELDGCDIPIIDTCALFVTIPNSDEYYTKIPENLKDSLRPVNLYSLEITNIIESLLLTLGFTECPDDADMLNVIFTVGKSIISEESRQFLSLHALIDVLYEGRKLKAVLQNRPEAEILANALAKRILPQIQKTDQKLLIQMIGDEFGFIPEILDQEDRLSEVLPEAATKCQLTESEYLFKKVMDLHSQAKSYKSIIIAGEPCSGKTSAVRLLEEARLLMQSVNDSYPIIDKIFLSPGMHKNSELFGSIDASTGKANEGVIGTVLGSHQQIPYHETWVIFDGDLEPRWTDVLITAFDGPHMLSLCNGGTCKISNEMKFIFETNDISKASPSILGRSGIITFSAKELGTDPFVKTALEQRIFPALSSKGKIVDRINEIVTETIVPGIDYIKDLTGIYSPYNTVDTLFSFFTILIKGQDYPNTTEGKNIISSVYAFAYLWAFGGYMNNSQRIQFELFVRDTMSKFCPTFPSRGILFDFSVNPANGRWTQWQEQVQQFGVNQNSEIIIEPGQFRKQKFLVQTQETTRMSAIMKLALSVRRHIIFTGASASGRSLLVNNVVNEMIEKNEAVSSLVPFSKLTTGEIAQTMILRCLERIGVKYLQPQGRKQGIIVVDRMNDPVAHETAEVMRSLFKGNGLRTAPTYQQMPTKNMSIIAITSLEPINPRLSTHAFTLQYTAPDSNTISNIIGSLLSIFFAKKFDESIRSNLTKYSQTISAFFEKLTQNIHATDSIPHLKFNTHNLFTALQGVFYATPKIVANADDLERLLFSQMARVFSDRITLPLNRKCFEESFMSTYRAKFGNELSMDNVYKSMFLDLSISQPDQLDQTYTEYHEEEIIAPFEKIINEFCETKKTQTEKILPLAASGVHMARLIRVLKLPRGNAIIYGNVGTGKSTVAKLALFASGSEVVEATSASDIRTAINKVGINGKKVTIVARNNVIQDEQFRNEVSILLSTDNPLVFLTAEDIDKGCNELVFYAKTIGADESIHTLKKFFIERVHQYLHVLFLIDSSDLTVFEDSPDIISHCIIDHFENLPDESLKSIANATFADFQESEKITDAAVFVHHSVLDVAQKMLKREGITYIITPSIFVNFLSTFKHIVEEKTDANTKLKQKYFNGTNKIKYVTDFLQSAEKLILETQPKYDHMTSEADRILHYINENEVTYEKMSQRLIYEEKTLQKKIEEINNLEKNIQDQIDSVFPQLSNAIAQLKGLNRGDIMDLKSISDPPVVIRTVMEVICILAEVDLGWKSSVQLLSDPTFINRISSKYNDTNHVAQEIMSRIKPYVESNPNFQESEVGRVSVAAKSLCLWATALYNYEVTYQAIQPDAKQIEAKKKVVKKDKDLLEKRRSDIQELNKTIQDLKDKCDSANKEKRKLAETMTSTKNRIAHAKRLLQILHEDDVRWKSQFAEEEKKGETLFYDAFLCATIIVYFGPMPSAYRDSTLNTVMNYMNENKLVISPRFSFVRSMADPQIVRSWIDSGLPDDRSCLESATIIMNSEKSPFILDKTGIAANFIKNVEESKQISVIRPTAHNFLRIIENSIKLGIPVLIEDNGEGFDPALEQLSLRKIYKQENKNYVKLGDRIAECEESYKVYMTVPLVDKPSAQAFTKANVINFEITKEAFAKQELQHIISIVNSSLAKEISDSKDQMICEERAIQQVQDRLLELLRTTPDDQILDDEILITTIEASKQSLQDSTRQLRACQQKIEDCQKQRDKYMPISQRIALISEAAAKLSKRNSNYCFSHAFIRHVVDSTLTGETGQPEEMIKKVTYTLFSAIARAMTYKDQLNFALTVATDLSISERRLGQEELNLLLKPPNVIKTQGDSPVPEIPLDAWQRLNAICLSLPALKHIPQAIISSQMQLEDWFKSRSVTLPHCISDGLTEFQCLLITRELKPKSFESALRVYIDHSLGKEFGNPIPFDLSKLLSIAGSTTPIIITLHGPVTATSYVKQLARGKKLHVRSLGQGQSQGAEKALTSAMQKGEWLLFENCEYLPSFITELDNIIAKGGANKNFLLFLSTKDVSKFPPRLLNLAAKCALESPQTTKSCVFNALESLPQEFFAGSLACRISLAYATAHASLIGRSRFKDLDFAGKCIFGISDFKYITHFIKPFIATPEQYSYPAIKSQVALAYAGHSKFDTDRDTIFALLERMLNEKILEPDNPIFGTEEVVTLPENRDMVFEFVKGMTDEESPQLFGLPKCAELKGEEVKQKPVSLMERRSFLDGVIKKLPEIDDIVPTVITEINNTVLIETVDINYQRNALNAIQAIARFKQITTRSDSKLWEREVPDDILELLPWPNPLDSFLSRLSTASETFNNWWRKARPPVIDLSSFADPRGFLSSIVTKHAHINRIPIRGIFLAAELPESIEQPAENGIYVTGLSLVGAFYDERNELIIDAEETVVNKLPVLHLIPVNDIPSDFFACPLYTECNGSKTLALKIPIAASRTESFWLQRGVHLILSQ